MQKISIILFSFVWLFHFGQAQSLERKVFSNGGGRATIGINTYLYTFGEPIVGTQTTGANTLTKGFHQPIDISLLPMSLIGPNAILMDQGVQLDWRANLAMGEGVMLVERSQDGKDFESLQELASLAIEGQLFTYTFIDSSVRRLAITQIWYRITLMSYSGELLQSDLVSVLFEPSKDIEFTIYPNPNGGNFIIRYYLDVDTEVCIRLLNNLGQVIWQQNRQLEAQLHEEALQLSSLPSGSYFLVMQTSRQQWTKTLLVQH